MSAVVPVSADEAAPEPEIVESIAFQAHRLKVTLHSGQTFNRPRKKVYYTMVSNEPADITLMEGIFKQMRTVRRKEKADTVALIKVTSEKARVALKAKLEFRPGEVNDVVVYKARKALATSTEIAKKSAIDSYGALLSKHHEHLLFLKDGLAGASCTLRKYPDLGDDNYEVWKGGLKIANLSPSKFERNPGTTERAVYTKTKLDLSVVECVNDNLGTLTKRFAYMEKNIHQFRDFLLTGRMEGRYQQLHKACNLQANKFNHLDNFIPRSLNEFSLAHDCKVRLALAHQFLGSGPHQRGLSLTLTNKKSVTFGNSGESFRSGDGVRIEVDLSLVPANVLVLNHYHGGAIIDESGYVVENAKGSDLVVKVALPGKDAPLEYKYVASVIKNREIYLEYLLPEWITRIEIHNGADEFEVPCAKLDIAAVRKAVEARVNQATFELGVDHALSDWKKGGGGVAPVPASMTLEETAAYTAGKSAVANFIAGWNEAETLDTLTGGRTCPLKDDQMFEYLQKVNKGAKGTDPTFETVKEPRTVTVPAHRVKGKRVPEEIRIVESQVVRRTEGTPPKYDMHWVGYAQRHRNANKNDIDRTSMWPKTPAAVPSDGEIVDLVVEVATVPASNVVADPVKDALA